MGKTKLNIVGDETNPPAGGKKQNAKGKKIAKVVVEPEVVAIETIKVEKKKTTGKPKAGHGKKYLAARAMVDPSVTYSLSDAAKLVGKTSISSFPGSVELHLVLNKNNFNTRIELPHSTGSTKKVEIASDETIEKLKTGKIDFDILLSAPDMMARLVPFAKLLGPKGLMPNPKQGTLIEDPEKAVEKFSGNQITLKTEKTAPLIHTVIGKVNQPDTELTANMGMIIETVGPKSIKKAVISASMGPSIRLAIS